MSIAVIVSLFWLHFVLSTLDYRQEKVAFLLANINGLEDRALLPHKVLQRRPERILPMDIMVQSSWRLQLDITNVIGQSSNITLGRSDEDEGDRLFRNFLSSSLVICIWLTLLVLSFVAFSPNFSDQSREQIFEGLAKPSDYHKYLIVLKFGYSSSKFQHDVAHIMIDFLDKNGFFITRIAVPNHWFGSARTTAIPTGKRPDLRVTRFSFNRCRPLPVVRFIRISHDRYSPPKATIRLYYVNVVNVVQKELTRIRVYSTIKALGPDAKANEQIFMADSPHRLRSIKDLEEIGPTLNLREGYLFSCYYINCTVLLVAIKSRYMRKGTLGQWITWSMGVSFISLLVTGSLAILLRSLKERLIRDAKSRKRWKRITTLFWVVLVILMPTMGGSGAVVASYSSTQMAIKWIVGVLLAITIFVGLYLPIILIVFFRDRFMGDSGYNQSAEASSHKVDPKIISSKVSLKLLPKAPRKSTIKSEILASHRPSQVRTSNNSFSQKK